MPSTNASQGPEKPPPSKPPDDRTPLHQTIQAHQTLSSAQSIASSLRQKAALATSPQERERMIHEAYEAEIASHGETKFARRLQSGPWQGAAAGGGIGLGTGLGVGAAVGTLVGGVVSIPTTGLGALIGTGVGAVRGPFIKVGGGKEKRWDEATREEVMKAAESEGKDGREAVNAAAAAGGERRKPRKLEIRSKRAEVADEGKPSGMEPMSEQQEAVPRRPKKLDHRSNSQLVVESASKDEKDGEDSAEV